MHRDIHVTEYKSAVGADGQLIDVREPSEVATGTLPGAVNIPVGRVADRLGELDPNRRVVLLCRSGGRSARVAEFLTQSGYDDVVNLAGGMLALPAGS